MNDNRAFGQMVAAIEDYAIFLLDEQGFIQSWNKGASLIKQYARNEVVGKHFSLFYTGQDLKEGLPGKLLQTARSQGKVSNEGWRRRRDGSLFWAHVTITSLRDESSQLIGFSKITRDMTARRQEQLALEFSEKRFRDLTQNIPGVIYQWEQKPNGERVLNYVSPKLLDLFGLHEDQIAHLTDLVHPEDRDRFEQAIKHRDATGEPWSFEGRMLYPDGSTKWWQGNSIRSQIGPDHYIHNGILIDISADKLFRAQMDEQQKRIEEELRLLNEQLSSSNSELEQFAYVASHDLQEPLRMVSSFLQLLREEYGSQLNGEGLEYIRFAVNGAERMKRMIRDLLQYSRLNNAGVKDEIVDTSSLVTELIQEMQEDIGLKKAKVHMEALPVVHANASLIQQLFQNLIGNALKYNRSESPLVEIGSESADGRPIFFVKDNGIGIAPEYHEKVFQVFQRLHSKKEFEGNGIGLSICRKIVEKHNGKIWIENPVQGGTAFKFTLS